MEKQWSLESFGTDGTPVEFVIAQLPYRVGRSKENDLTIPALGLSRFHAVLERDARARTLPSVRAHRA